MTWPSPPRPIDGMARAIFSLAVVLLLAWLASPVFNFLMRVLQ